MATPSCDGFCTCPLAMGEAMRELTPARGASHDDWKMLLIREAWRGSVYYGSFTWTLGAWPLLVVEGNLGDLYGLSRVPWLLFAPFLSIVLVSWVLGSWAFLSCVLEMPFASPLWRRRSD